MQTLQNSIKVFLNHCEFERNFSFHTIKAYRLDLAQFTHFAVERCQSDDVTQVCHSHIRKYARSLHHANRELNGGSLPP
jgi:integrase/recombinase XerC